MGKTKSQILNLLTSHPADDCIEEREGPGGKSFTYLPGWYGIETSNEVFESQWESHITRFEIAKLYEGEYTRSGKTINFVEAIAYATVRIVFPVIGAEHEDVGVGNGRVNRSDGWADAIEQACKQAVTDARKRAERHLGNLYGNSLYKKTEKKPAPRKPAGRPAARNPALRAKPKEKPEWLAVLEHEGLADTARTSGLKYKEIDKVWNDCAADAVEFAKKMHGQLDLPI